MMSRGFKNTDDTVFGVLLSLTAVLGVLLLLWTVQFILGVGSSGYLSPVSSLVALITAGLLLRCQLRSDTIRWWSYVVLLSACAWAFISYFSLPIHDAVHILLGMEECDGSDAYSIAALAPLILLALTAFFAIARWLASIEGIRATVRSVQHWLTTYERLK